MASKVMLPQLLVSHKDQCKGSVADPPPYHCGKPDLDPHQSEKPDPDLHQTICTKHPLIFLSRSADLQIQITDPDPNSTFLQLLDICFKS